MARLFLVLFFLGQNRLEHVTGFGNVREVDFWLYRWCSTA
jgi:hypothetical protein